MTLEPRSKPPDDKPIREEREEEIHPLFHGFYMCIRFENYHLKNNNKKKNTIELN